jgi:hypothetical protein
LLVADLAATSAGSAWDWGLAGGSAGAAAFLASFVAAHVDIRFRAEDRLFEFQGDIFSQIGAALGAAASTGTAAEKISEAEEIAEDFADILKNSGIEATRSPSADSSVSEAVVCGALIRIGENGVGLAAFFKFFFRVGIIWIAVRMKLQRQLAIGALDLLIVGFAGNPKNFVVVAFYIAGQNGFESFRLCCG